MGIETFGTQNSENIKETRFVHDERMHKKSFSKTFKMEPEFDVGKIEVKSSMMGRDQLSGSGLGSQKYKKNLFDRGPRNSVLLQQP